jgi:next-to-BRCA1 protein 1
LQLRTFLGVFENQVVIFERFSDSSASYVNLDPNNLHAYKTLYRAAKAKLKLRLRAHIGPVPYTTSDPISSPTVEQRVNTNFQETLRSLANLNFGSEMTLANLTMPPSPPAIVSSTPTYQAPTVVSDHEPVAAAIASFASQAPASAAPLVVSDHAYATPAPSNLVNIPVQSAADAKSADFSKKIREIDEQLKQKIGAHRSRHLSNEKFGSPITRESATKEQFKTHPAFQTSKSGCPVLRMSNPPKLPDGATYSWSVYCNQCNKNMLDEHYHCNSCENGDYDLCIECMAKGKHCLDENHWLIKRLLRDGKVVNATTEKHCFASSPKIKSETSLSQMPGAFTDEKKLDEVKKPTRTCNCCVKGMIFFSDLM